MAHVDWSIRGIEYGSCNCDYGCPCQFESRPTHGHCRGFEAIRIEQGHFGDVGLDGLKAAMLYAWPGAVYEGNGEAQAVIDERADERQRDALLKVLTGQETEPFATHWAVYGAMCKTVHPPLFAPIEFEVDVAARTGRVVIPGLLESIGRPIRSPVSGDPHRAQIRLPNGIEFRLAEIGSGITRATGVIELDLRDTYAQFNELHHTPIGPALS